MADTGDLDNLSMPVGNAAMNGVKVGESFQLVLMATPSEDTYTIVRVTCRDETAPSYPSCCGVWRRHRPDHKLVVQVAKAIVV